MREPDFWIAWFIANLRVMVMRALQIVGYTHAVVGSPGLSGASLFWIANLARFAIHQYSSPSDAFARSQVYHPQMDSNAVKKGALALAKAVLLAVVAAVTKELWEGQPIKGFARLRTYEHVLTSPVPFWILLLAFIIIVLLLPHWWLTLRRSEPELHVAWHGSAGWGISGILQKDGSIESVLRIQGSAIISSSHLKEPVIATGIELDRAEYAGPNFRAFEIRPGETLSETLLLNFRGVLPEPGKAFTANLTVLDIKGARYRLLPVLLRAFPGHAAPTVEPPTSTPLLHASWRADSAWGWASSHPEEDPIYLIRGDVTLHMDNIKEHVMITGVEIEGADSMGAFDNFQMVPNQPQVRGMRLHFRGKAPRGNEHFTVQLIFKDLRSNRYPTIEHRFMPLPIDERVKIERGAL
jgi:hypothetical protein